MIIILAEFGGEGLLGKAREIADTRGYKVLAICSKLNEKDAQRLIYLGADEVELYESNSVESLKDALVHTLRERKGVRFVFLPANVSGNFVLGALAANQEGNGGPIVDDSGSISEYEITRILHPSDAIMSFKQNEAKVALCSIKLSSVSLPIEDESRYGRVKSSSFSTNKNAQVASLEPNHFPSSSTRLTLLLGRKFAEHEESMSSLQELAKKYGARLLIMTGSVQVIYGPCLAIEVDSRSGDLPEFQGDLTVLNSSSGFAIQRIGNLSLVCPDIEGVVRELISTHS